MISFVNANSFRIPLADKSVHCVVTSPPYWALRNYKNNNSQIGREKTPQLYVDSIQRVMQEVYRVLDDRGTLWLNLGDTYSGTGSKGKHKDPKYTDGRNGQSIAINGKIIGLPRKSLIGIPWRVAFAMQDFGWILRRDIVWNKPNAMPSPVRDRPVASHEFIFLFSKRDKYFFNQEAIREPYTKPMNRWAGDKLEASGKSEWDGGTGQKTYRNRNMRPNPAGRNGRDVWSINTSPSRMKHFATFPLALAEKMILAGTRKGDLVLDPFSGSGTSAKACAKHGRDFVGLDIELSYIVDSIDASSGIQISLL